MWFAVTDDSNYNNPETGVRGEKAICRWINLMEGILFRLPSCGADTFEHKFAMQTPM